MKKVLAFVLASTMVLGMAVTAFAADPVTKINDIPTGALADGYDKTATLGYSATKKVGPSSDNQTVSYSTEIRPHDKVKDYIDLYADSFIWDKGNPSGQKKLSAKEIRDAKMTVRQSVSAGSKAIDKISIDNKKGYIEIKYVEEYVSTKELDFDFTVYLLLDGKRYTDAGLTFVGTLENDVQPVYAEDDYVDTSNGVVAEAQDFVKAVEVDLGNGVSIMTKMFKDKKYYGTATREEDDDAAVVFAKYPDVDNVVILKTVGLNQTGDIVKLDNDSSDYYVYDKDLNYVGRSNEVLPYSTRYYLANKELDVTGSVDETDVPEIEDGDISNPGSGGDETYENANANPSTGC